MVNEDTTILFQEGTTLIFVKQTLNNYALFDYYKKFSEN